MDHGGNDICVGKSYCDLDKKVIGSLTFVGVVELATNLVYLELVKEFASRVETGPGASSFRPITHSTKRHWHDSLKRLSQVRTPLVQSKQRVIAAWKELGAIFGLREGVNVTTLYVPSTPSDERKYWNIPKHCHYGPCICSLPLLGGKPYHALRACKGCYRVLYCNDKCQSL